MNPQETENTTSNAAQMYVGFEGGTVTNAPPHTSGDSVQHHVEVTVDHFDEPLLADVVVGQHGDASIPPEGTRVIIGYRPNERASVVGVRYASYDDVPEYEPGERIVGHPTTDSHIKLANDGSVQVEGDSGNSVELRADGTVVVNDGGTAPITDISFGTDSDGNYTSHTVTRADDVFVPSK